MSRLLAASSGIVALIATVSVMQRLSDDHYVVPETRSDAQICIDEGYRFVDPRHQDLVIRQCLELMARAR